MLCQPRNRSSHGTNRDRSRDHRRRRTHPTQRGRIRRHRRATRPARRNTHSGAAPSSRTPRHSRTERPADHRRARPRQKRTDPRMRTARLVHAAAPVDDDGTVALTRQGETADTAQTTPPSMQYGAREQSQPYRQRAGHNKEQKKSMNTIAVLAAALLIFATSGVVAGPSRGTDASVQPDPSRSPRL